MSELKFETMTLPGRRLGKDSWYPGIRELIKSEISAELDEDDGLFIGYGMFSDNLPYTMQDSYDGDIEKLTFRTLIFPCVRLPSAPTSQSTKALSPALLDSAC